MRVPNAGAIYFIISTVLGMQDSSPNVVFFGHDSKDQHMMMSTVSYSLDHHRKMLGNLMKEIDFVIQQMDSLDERDGRRRLIHDKFRHAAMQLPNLWESNEDVLNYLIHPQSIHLKYAIKAPKNLTYLTIDRNDSPQNYAEGRARSRDSRTDAGSAPRSAVNVPSYDTMEQVLVHLSRDWSRRGEKVRKNLYDDGFLSTLSTLIDDPVGRRVLVPGAGLGRLAAELAVKGFSTEANECSAVMASAMHTLFHKVLYTDSPDQITMYPHISPNLMDSWDFSARLQPVTFPSSDSSHITDWLRGTLEAADGTLKTDIIGVDDQGFLPGQERGLRDISSEVTGEISAPSNESIEDTMNNTRHDEIKHERSKGSLSIQFGDFVSVYSHEDSAMSFDVVVTCFFIDTAVDVVDYIDVIAHVLKEGGLWLNAGPLHYHSKQSVPYSHSQLVEIVRQSGFDVVSRTVIPSTSYCGEEGLSMRTEYYDVPLDVFRLAPHIDTPGSHAVSAPKITANDGIIWRRPDLKLP